MKTLDNGVILFETFSEWMDAHEDETSIYVYPCDSWDDPSYKVRLPATDNDSRLVTCENKQDALDIAAMFAERNKPDCPNCKHTMSSMVGDTHCGRCLDSGKLIGYERAT